MVSVFRIFYDKGDNNAYSRHYFQEKSTVGNWREQRRVSVAHSKWTANLKAHQKEMNRLGIGFAVDSIGDDIEVRMVVPINQKDKRFGDRNSKLVGKVVETTGLRIIEDEIKIHYPIQDSSISRTSLPSLNPMSLELKQSYKLSDQTPLMSELNPDDPMAALGETKYMSSGLIIKIARISKLHSNPWYKVSVTNGAGTHLGIGWINSIALIGQDLEAIQPKDDTENRNLTKRVQQILGNLGYSPGPIDGVPGPKTKSAIQAFQRANKLKVDGTITSELLAAMERTNTSNDPDWELVEAWKGELAATYFVLIDFNKRADSDDHWRVINNLCKNFPSSCMVHFNSSRVEAERFEPDSCMRSVTAMFSNFGNRNELAFDCSVRNDKNCF